MMKILCLPIARRPWSVARRLFPVALSVTWMLAAPPAASGQAADYDIVIRNGMKIPIAPTYLAIGCRHMASSMPGVDPWPREPP